MAIITIARQFGAGGRTLGAMIAKKLDYQFLDDALIQELARIARVTPNTIKNIERSGGGLISKMISSMISKDYMERLTGDKIGYMDEDIYVEKLREVITGFAKKDKVVILGRGGQYILSDWDNAIHVLLIANEKDRIKFMQKHYNLSGKKALQLVKDDEKRRKNLYSKFGRKDYDSPELYHVVINTSRVSLDQGVAIICDLLDKHS